MAGACKTLDPIEAAEAGIAGSKDLIAAVARDLGQHQRWLAHYHVAEKRHARRLMVQDLLYRLELARWRLVRMLTRLALRSFRLARAIALTLTNAALTILARLHRAAIAAVEWLRPRAYALSLKFWGWLVAFGARAAALSRATALILRNWLAASFAMGSCNLVRRGARDDETCLGCVGVAQLALAPACPPPPEAARSRVVLDSPERRGRRARHWQGSLRGHALDRRNARAALPLRCGDGCLGPRSARARRVGSSRASLATEPRLSCRGSPRARAHLASSCGDRSYGRGARRVFSHTLRSWALPTDRPRSPRPHARSQRRCKARPPP